MAVSSHGVLILVPIMLREITMGHSYGCDGAVGGHRSLFQYDGD